MNFAREAALIVGQLISELRRVFVSWGDRIRNRTLITHMTAYRGTQLNPLVLVINLQVHDIKRMLDRGVDLHMRDHYGFTLLHLCAAIPDSIEVMRMLVSRGARGDTFDSFGSSTLFTALYHRQPLPVIQLLVEAGADPAGRHQHTGQPVLHLAGQLERRDVIDYLLDVGVDPNTRTLDDGNVLLCAFPEGSLDFIKHLVLVCGVDMNVGPRLQQSLMPHFMRGGSTLNDWSITTDFYRKAEKMRFCLLAGANWLADPDMKLPPVMLSRLLMGVPCNWCLMILLQHMVLRELMELPVDRRSRSMVYDNINCALYMRQCKRELTSMMSQPIYKRITAYTILTVSEARMIGYLRNIELRKTLTGICYEEIFPIYCDAILEKLTYCLELYHTQRKAVAVLHRTLGSLLNPHVVEEIAKRMSRRELHKMSGYY